MELNRIMIVDDEEDFRLGVIKKMDWESIGFEVVGDASNGQDALDLIEQINPDVIITDIK
ncbi:MAG TPA: DNA-binding response regulator, partial [Lachnospiraceae bacterium]|nr:DNA-binding response regulator [Lachnospiraceae bacterium]